MVSFPQFPHKTLYTTLLSRIRATCPAHLILLELIQSKEYTDITLFLQP